MQFSHVMKKVRRKWSLDQAAYFSFFFGSFVRESNANSALHLLAATISLRLACLKKRLSEWMFPLSVAADLSTADELLKSSALRRDETKPDRRIEDQLKPNNRNSNTPLLTMTIVV